MLDRELDVALRSLAAQQHLLVARRQARELGASREQLATRLASPDWELATSRVLRLAGGPLTAAQRCMAAVLDAGPRAVVSHGSAAALWGLPGFRVHTIDVSRPRGGTRRPSGLAVIHEPRLLLPAHCSVVENIPVTTPARTIFDLAGCCHPARSERALDNAWSRGLVKPGELWRLAEQLCRQGRPGSTLMRLLLRERGWNYVPPDTGLECRFLAELKAAGLELPECQVEIGGLSWIGRVDFLYRAHKLVIEIDSDRHHTSKLDREADAERDRALRAAGFEVLRITETQVYERPSEVVRKVRTALVVAAAA